MAAEFPNSDPVAGTPQATPFDTILTQCRDLVCERLSVALAAMLDEVDQTISTLISESRNANAKKLYAQTREKVVAQRETIETQFRARYLREFQRRSNRVKKIGDSFAEIDLSSLELELVGDDDLDETLKFNAVASKLRQYCDEELVALDQRVGVLLGDASLQAEDNPFTPQAICDAYKDTCRQLDSNVEVRMVLLKLFDDHVVDDIRAVYKAVNALLVQNSILPKIRIAARKEGSKTPAPEVLATPLVEAPPKAFPQAQQIAAAGEQDLFSILQSLRANSLNAMPQTGAGAGAAPGTPGAGAAAEPAAVVQGPELLGLLTRIQLGDTSGVPANMLPVSNAPGVSGQPGMANVLRELKNSGVGTGMNQLDTMTLDIMSLVFDQLFDDPKIPVGVKGLIGRLQIPMLKVAIADKTFFSKKTHPARLLLDALGEMSLRLPPDFNTSSPQYGRMEVILQEIIERFEDKMEVFDVARERLETLIAEEDRRVDEEIKVAANLIEQREKLALAKTVAQAEIKARVRVANVPVTVIEFLLQQWVQILLFVHVVDGEDSDAWRNALETVDLLIWSVEPKITVTERRELAAIVPELLQRLVAGLRLVDADDAIRADFFGDLRKIHTGIIGKPGAEDSPDRHDSTRVSDSVETASAAQPAPDPAAQLPPVPAAGAAPLSAPAAAPESAPQLAPEPAPTATSVPDLETPAFPAAEAVPVPAAESVPAPAAKPASAPDLEFAPGVAGEVAPVAPQQPAPEPAREPASVSDLELAPAPAAAPAPVPVRATQHAPEPTPEPAAVPELITPSLAAEAAPVPATQPAPEPTPEPAIVPELNFAPPLAAEAAPVPDLEFAPAPAAEAAPVPATKPAPEPTPEPAIVPELNFAPPLAAEAAPVPARQPVAEPARGTGSVPDLEFAPAPATEPAPVPGVETAFVLDLAEFATPPAAEAALGPTAKPAPVPVAEPSFSLDLEFTPAPAAESPPAFAAEFVSLPALNFAPEPDASPASAPSTQPAPAPAMPPTQAKAAKPTPGSAAQSVPAPTTAPAPATKPAAAPVARPGPTSAARPIAAPGGQPASTARSTAAPGMQHPPAPTPQRVPAPGARPAAASGTPSGPASAGQRVPAPGARPAAASGTPSGPASAAQHAPVPAAKPAPGKQPAPGAAAQRAITPTAKPGPVPATRPTPALGAKPPAGPAARSISVPPARPAPGIGVRPGLTPPGMQRPTVHAQAPNLDAVDFNAPITVQNPFGGGKVEVDDLDLDFTVKPAAGAPGAKRDASLAELPANLAVGTWVGIREKDEKGARRSAKLSFISPLKTRYLFVDKQGKAILDCSRADLARRFKIGDVIIMDKVPEVPLFDRLTDGLVGKLGGAKPTR